jgi:ABC-type glutathione transport system ATPase component
MTTAAPVGAARDGAKLLEVRNLTVRFPARRGHPSLTAVDRVSFDVAAGRTLGLVGQSGSGKTTTGRAVLQLLRADEGSVTLMGKDLTRLSSSQLRRMRRHMQLVQQNPYASLHPRLTIVQTLSEPLRVHATVPRDRVYARVAELLELVNLDPAWMQRYPSELSGGQRQRVVIARALAVDPAFVVCDEPVSALDVRTQAQIVALLRSLQDKLGLSYLFIAHDLAVVREVAHDVAVMYGGCIVEMGAASQVYGTPGHPYTRALLDAVPIPDPSIQRRKLRVPSPELRFDGAQDELCGFGEDHAATGTARWHQLAPGHGISCRFWPPASVHSGRALNEPPLERDGMAVRGGRS